MVPGGITLNIEKGQWHGEPGTFLFEVKDGVYRPLDEDEVWNGLTRYLKQSGSSVHISFGLDGDK